MSLATLYSRGNVGIDAPLVTIEVHIASGLPTFHIVGLPEAAVRESRDRVRSAIVNSQFEFPCRRIIVNLAPADLPKEGGRFDLPIALGILAASQQIPMESLRAYEFAGELALDGEIRPVKALLPFALATLDAERRLVIPAAQTLPKLAGLEAYVAQHLLQVCAYLRGKISLPSCEATPSARLSADVPHTPDLADVLGQYAARRALEVAASGEHSLLLSGSPGAGKTLMASCLPALLPAPTEAESLAIAKIYALFEPQLTLSWGERPYRAPHHTASTAAVVGGGHPPIPGEISLAHHGVLFLDELPEFCRSVLEALREPLESSVITISRSGYQVQYPAQFQLIAAMNPCPCGYAGDPSGRCDCAPQQIKRYQARLSGPLFDRIDLHVTVQRQSLMQAFSTQKDNLPESSAAVQARVSRARVRQHHRQGRSNARLDTAAMAEHCYLASALEREWLTLGDQLELSMRTLQRLRRVARTIADLAESTNIEQSHLQEALCYR